MAEDSEGGVVSPDMGDVRGMPLVLPQMSDILFDGTVTFRGGCEELKTLLSDALSVMVSMPGVFSENKLT